MVLHREHLQRVCPRATWRAGAATVVASRPITVGPWGARASVAIVPQPLVVDSRVTLPGEDLAWTATRSSGPGGQNVNKVSSRVQLRFDLSGTTALDEATKERLRAIAAGSLDAAGRILVTSDLTRDQHRNLEDARQKLRQLVARALVVPKRRRPTRPSRSATARRLDEKRRQGDKKRLRRDDG